MIFGYNTDVKSGNTVYHVQTEDRGERNPVIDSVIYVKGRIVDRRRTPYQPGESSPERLQEMVKQQHRELVDSIRSGTYMAPEAAGNQETVAMPAVVPKAGDGPHAKVEAPAALSLALTNARDLDKDGRLQFRLRVLDRGNGRPLAGAIVRAVLDPGEEQEARSQATASSDGIADIHFDAPAREDVAVLFQATAEDGVEFLKFRLRKQEPE